MIPTDAIAPALAAALADKGYETLTEVQTAVLTDEAAGRDLLVSAQTGSGKTVAFGIAMAHDLLGDEGELPPSGAPLGLIIAPTRELALQVQRELVWLYRETGAWIASCVGGMDPRSERRVLEKGCHIVVGTPGRLRDHIERRALDLTHIRAAVLDEADEMLDFGFKEDLEFILDHCPDERRTLLFSATVPRDILHIADSYQNDSLRIKTAGETQQHGDITYHVHPIVPHDRDNAIINLLRFHDAARTIVFCATREAVNRLTSKLGNRGFSTVALSGELSQTERSHALAAIRDGRARVCIATDVAARGIDLPGLELVIHADLPTNSETLLHRSGRTGRAGQKGICALIVPASRMPRAQRLLKMARLDAQWGAAPSMDTIRQKDSERLYADPVFNEAGDETLNADATALIETFGAEAVARAFLLQRQASLPAAEDLLEVRARTPKDRPEREPREPLTDTVWFALTAGRKKRAEARWLLPLICRVGDINKSQIGAIRIGEEETRFEIDARFVDAFKASVEENGGGEKSIRILPADGPGEMEVPPRDSGPRERRGPRKPRFEDRDDRDDRRGDRREDRRDRGERNDRGGRDGGFDKRPPRRDRDDRDNRFDKGERKPRYDKAEGEKSFEKGDRFHKGERFEKRPRRDRDDARQNGGGYEQRPRRDRDDTRKFDGDRPAKRFDDRPDRGDRPKRPGKPWAKGGDDRGSKPSRGGSKPWEKGDGERRGSKPHHGKSKPPWEKGERADRGDRPGQSAGPKGKPNRSVQDGGEFRARKPREAGDGPGDAALKRFKRKRPPSD